VLTLVARPLRWRLLALYVPVVVGWLPLVRFALSHRDRIDWIQPTTVDLATTELLALGGGLVVGAVLLLALALGMRRDVIALWLVLPIAGTLAMSLIVQPLFEMRYLLSAVPAAAVIAARNRWWLVAVLVGVSLVGAWNWYGDTDAKDDWRSATAWVATAIQPGDGIVFAPHYLRVPFGYHARIGEPLWAPVPWSASDLFTTPPDAELVRAHRRIWLVEGHVVDLPPEITAALAGFRPAEQRSYAGPNGLRVTLLVAGALP
jgi:hypothetical protein